MGKQQKTRRSTLWSKTRTQQKPKRKKNLAVENASRNPRKETRVNKDHPWTRVKTSEGRSTRHNTTASSPPRLHHHRRKPSTLHRETETPPEQETGPLNSSSSPGLEVTEIFNGHTRNLHPSHRSSPLHPYRFFPQRNQRRSEAKSSPSHHWNTEKSTKSAVPKNPYDAGVKNPTVHLKWKGTMSEP
ncbi:Uncharacterized protein Rs2_13956 [Raphanus sativus]|nr:Uncharacterized protein Rs2_13956 [Raphanus sativus]